MLSCRKLFSLEAFAVMIRCALVVFGGWVVTTARAQEPRLTPVRVLEGHEDDVHDVAFGPRGVFLASAGFDGTVRIWRPSGGDGAEAGEVAVFRGHEGKVFCVDFLPDGRSIVTAGEDKTVRQWNLPSTGPLPLVDEVVERFATNGSAWAAYQRSRNVVLHSETGSFPWTPTSEIRVAATSEDGSQVAFATEKEITLWDLRLPQWEAGDDGMFSLVAADAKWRFFRGRSEPPKEWLGVHFDDSKWEKGPGGFGFSPNPNELKSVNTVLEDMAGADGYLSLYSRAPFSVPEGAIVKKLLLRVTYDDGFVAYWNGTEVARLNAEGSPPTFRSGTPDTKEPELEEIDLTPRVAELLAEKNSLAVHGLNQVSTSSDFVLTVSLVADLEIPPEAEADRTPPRRVEIAGVRSMAFHGDDMLLAAVGSDVVRIPLADPAAAAHSAADETVAHVVPLGDSSVAIAGESGLVEIRSLEDGTVVHRLEGHEGPVRSLGPRSDGLRLLSAGDDGTVRLWDAVEGKELRRIAAHDGGARAVAFGDENGVAVSGGADKRVAVWDLDSGEQLHSLEAPSVVSLVAYRGDQRFVAVADGRILEWKLVEPGESRKLEGHEGIVHSVAASPGGELIASGGSDKTLRIWNVADGSSVHSIEAHGASVYCVRFHPDGRKVASAGYEGVVKLWDAREGTELEAFSGHDEGVANLVFSRDGTTLYSCSFDGTVRGWDIDDDAEPLVFRGHRGWVFGVALAPSRAEVVSLDFSGQIGFWAYDGGEPRRTRSLRRVAYDLAVSPDGAWIATAHRGGVVDVYAYPGSE